MDCSSRRSGRLGLLRRSGRSTRLLCSAAATTTGTQRDSHVDRRAAVLGGIEHSTSAPGADAAHRRCNRVTSRRDVIELHDAVRIRGSRRYGGRRSALPPPARGRIRRGRSRCGISIVRSLRAWSIRLILRAASAGSTSARSASTRSASAAASTRSPHRYPNHRAGDRLVVRVYHRHRDGPRRLS